jgi:hypothetical protein
MESKMKMKLTIAAFGLARDIDTAKFPQTTRDYWEHYGVKQSGNDHFADQKKYPRTPEGKKVAEEAFDKWLERAEKGELSVRESGDPIATRAKILATKKVAVAYRAKGWKVDPKADQFKKHVADLAARNDTIALAKKQLAAEKKELDAIAVDLA